MSGVAPGSRRLVLGGPTRLVFERVHRTPNRTQSAPARPGSQGSTTGTPIFAADRTPSGTSR